MKTVTEANLTARIVRDAAQIRRLRWFQHRRYFESGLLNDISTTLPEDPAVARSAYFGVYDGDTIAATARIVCSGPMPLLDHHAITPRYRDRLDCATGQVAEISRFAVGHKAPHYVALTILCRELLQFSIDNADAALLIASVERPFVRIIGRLLGVPVHIIGNEIDGYGNYNGACVPILIDAAECLRTFAARESHKWDFFTDELVINLTADVPQPWKPARAGMSLMQRHVNQ